MKIHRTVTYNHQHLQGTRRCVLFVSVTPVTLWHMEEKRAKRVGKKSLDKKIKQIELYATFIK